MSNIKSFILRTLASPCRLLPLQDKVVFANFNGCGMGDDPKYIAMELLRRKSKARLIWLANDVKDSFPPGITPIRFNSWLSYYHLFTAKVWVNNIKHSKIWMNKRQGQFYLQTWHGTIASKKVEQDAKGLSRSYIKSAIHDASITDLMYSNNDFFLRLYRTRFWYQGEVLKCDVPRVSMVMNPPVGLKQKVFSQLGISMDCKTALYAPTFRRTIEDSLRLCNLDFDQIRTALETRFGGEYVIVVRLHPNIASKASMVQYGSHVVCGSRYPDMQELMSVADVALTDYSSWIYDYAIKHKPVFVYAPDLDDYVRHAQGLYFTPRQAPFPVAETPSELLQAIVQFDAENYRSRLQAFYDGMGYVDTGHGAEAIADIIESKLG